MLFLFLGIVIAAAIGLWFFMNSENGVRWAQHVIRQRFPDVDSITPAELNIWLHQDGRPQPVLIDVRTTEEQAASTLPGAHCVAPDASAERVLAGMDRTRPIVVYCAAGYRAAAMARRLQQAGCTQVKNLEGGIFAWANEGYGVEKNGVPTAEVHPYSSAFARMLKNRK